MPRLRVRTAALGAVAAFALAAGARDVSACGGLVAPNGAVRLAHASTLVAWHGGVEHYMTSFAYQGSVTDVGWLVPLPAVPDSVVKGGAWTLQRLAREAQPPIEEDLAGSAAAPAAKAVVIQTTVIDALDITVLRGSGQAVLDWTAANHFAVNAETRDHILAYAATSPIFMAAKYDLTQAVLRHTFAGDGTPVLITMHTPHLWVPLEVLANADDPIDADLYLLTDARPSIGGIALDAFGGGPDVLPGMTLLKQEAMTSQLHTDLSTDRGMGWVQPGGWFTALHIGTTGSVLTYDMSVTTTGELAVAPMGAGPDAVVAGASFPALPAAEAGRTTAIGLGIAGGTAGLVLVGTLGLLAAGRRRPGRAR